MSGPIWAHGHLWGHQWPDSTVHRYSIDVQKSGNYWLLAEFTVAPHRPHYPSCHGFDAVFHQWQIGDCRWPDLPSCPGCGGTSCHRRTQNNGKSSPDVKGSPTWVTDVVPDTHAREGRIIAESNPARTIELLLEDLAAHGLLYQNFPEDPAARITLHNAAPLRQGNSLHGALTGRAVW